MLVGFNPVTQGTPELRPFERERQTTPTLGTAPLGLSGRAKIIDLVDEYEAFQLQSKVSNYILKLPSS